MRFVVISTALAGMMLAGPARNADRQDMAMAQEVPSQDARVAIALPVAERDMFLTEMRGLLTAVNGMLRGVATRDTALLRASAVQGGMAGMMHGGMGRRGMGGGAMRGSGMMGMGRGMGPAMPEGFRALYHATRFGFDSLAERISRGVTPDTVVARLATLTGNCVACHATYRFEVRAP